MIEPCPTCEGEVCGVGSPRTPSIADAYREVLERLASGELGQLDGVARAAIRRVLDEYKLKPRPWRT